MESDFDPSSPDERDHAVGAGDSDSGPSYEASDESPGSSSSPSSPRPNERTIGDDPVARRDGISPLKRSAEPHDEQVPSKRYKATFNHAYMDLLNVDIEDAANQLVLEKRPTLKSKQVGMVVWTSLENDLFYEALSRLGRDDLPGIASRVRTKNELEVRQYLKLIEDQSEQKQSDPHYRWEDLLEMADYPAAKELSGACCDALEEVADDLSLRVERHEQKAEEKKWGEYWLVNGPIAKLIDEGNAGEHPLKFAELFNLQPWLRLPKRIFMNSPVEGDNWQDIADEPPAIRSTALEDFHALTVAVTRKLVMSSLYMAQSRIKAKQVVQPNIRQAVKGKDVEAALASTGMKRDSRRYWATCARRLKLQVHDTQFEDGAGLGGDDEDPPMSYDEVEDQLLPRPDEPAHIQPRVIKAWRNQKTMHAIDFELSDTSSILGEDGEQQAASDSAASGSEEDGAEQEQDEDLAVRDEASEALRYAVNELPKTHRTQEAVEMRVRLEREQERYAEAVDAQVNFAEESVMWKLVRRSPPESMVKPEQTKPPAKSTMGLREVHDSGTRWRGKLEHASEWETYGFSRPWDPKT
ncbi:hypothetical protein ACHAQA_005314 [Verticillium albo-atrum]